MNVQFEKKLLKKALKYGFSSEVMLHVFRFRRIAGNPKDWMQRKRAAREICASSAYSDFINKKTGYRMFGANELPGTMDAVRAAQQIFESKPVISDAAAKKSYFYNILERDDLVRFPQLLAFARQEAVLTAATGYLGSLPKLNAIGVYYTPVNESFEKSQLYHCDGEDAYQVKCFINVNDVKPENGPFTFIPADKSSEVRSKLRHNFRGRRLTDEDIQASGAANHEISLNGNEGSGCMVDTSRCLHYGSRCRAGHRLVIMFQYMRMPDVALLTAADRADGSGRALHI